MKALTPNLLKFILVAIVLTLVFRYFLSYGIAAKSNLIITVSAGLYGLLMFSSGFFFGKRDGEYLPFYDIGFRSHLATYIICNGIGELWFLLGLNSGYEKIEVIHQTAIIWGMFLFAHFCFFLYTRKNAVVGLDKDDLFE